jgi:hypothetical protein
MWFPCQSTQDTGPTPERHPEEQPPRPSRAAPRTEAPAPHEIASSSNRSQSPPSRRRRLGPGTPHPTAGHVRSGEPPAATPGNVHIPDDPDDPDE